MFNHYSFLNYKLLKKIVLTIYLRYELMQTYILVHSPWETYIDDQDKSSLQLGGIAL